MTTNDTTTLQRITPAQRDTIVYHYANLDYSPHGHTYRRIQDYCEQHGHDWVLAPRGDTSTLEKFCIRCLRQEEHTS